MASSDVDDPYLDPQTGLLRNLTVALTKDALDEAEGDFAFVRLVQLMDHPPSASSDHHQLFQDVFAWAGQVRTVDIRKNVEGAEFFLPVSMIARAAAHCAYPTCP